MTPHCIKPPSSTCGHHHSPIERFLILLPLTTKTQFSGGGPGQSIPLRALSSPMTESSGHSFADVKTKLQSRREVYPRSHTPRQSQHPKQGGGAMGPRLPLPPSAENRTVLKTRGARHFVSVPAGSNPDSRERNNADSMRRIHPSPKQRLLPRYPIEIRVSYNQINQNTPQLTT